MKRGRTALDAFVPPGWGALIDAYARQFETRDDALVYAGTIEGLADGHAARDRVWLELEVAALRWPETGTDVPPAVWHAMRRAAWLAIKTPPAPSPVMRRAETLSAWGAFLDALRPWMPPTHAEYLAVIDGIAPCGRETRHG